MVQVSSVRVRIRIVFKYELGFGCPYWSTGAGRMPVLQLKNEYGLPILLLDSSRILADCQLADSTIRRLDISQTGQLTDQSSHGLDKSGSRHLADATGSSSFCCNYANL